MIQLLSHINQCFLYYLPILGLAAGGFLPRPVLAQDEAAVPFDSQLVARNSTYVHVADLDQDNIPDVIVSDEFDDEIVWYKNNGSGEFTENELDDVVENARIVSVADMNGDGRPDIVAGRYKLVCYYSDEDLEFEDNAIISDFENNLYDIHINDLDNDGDQDVLVGTITPNQIRWYRNDGNRTFTLQTINVDSGEGIISHATPDINGDGLPDIVCAYRERDLLSSTNKASVAKETTTNSPSPNARSRDSKTIAYLINQGNGAFGSPQILTNQIDHPESVAAADLDGDGLPDILSASTDDSKVAWYRNTSREDANKAFGNIKVISQKLRGVKEAIAADIDGDGDADVVAASFSGNKRLVWFENDGKGNFSSEENLIARLHARWIDKADTDNDGDIDLVAVDAYTPRNVFYYENLSPARPSPVISSFAPQITQVDSIITISGSNMGNNINNVKVNIGGKDSKVLQLNEAATQLQARVPDLAPGSYPLQLVTKGKTVTASSELNIQPYLTSLSPNEIIEGKALIINGRNFRSATNDIQVKLNDQIISEGITVGSSTEISLQLPARITRGSYSATVLVNQQASNSLTLNVVETPNMPSPAPVISSFAPQAAPIDSVVTVNGENLNDADGETDSVNLLVGGTTATITSVNEAGTQLQFAVPNLFPGSYTLQLTANRQSAIAAEKLNIRPYLAALLPKQIRMGRELMLTGNNFRSQTNDIQVQLNDTILQEGIFVNVAGTEARILLPQGIVAGNYQVTIMANGQASNKLPLTVVGSSGTGVDNTPPAFANSNLEQLVFGDSVFTYSASITEDSSDISQVIIRFGGITGNLSNVQVLDADATPFDFSIDIPASMDDPLGIRYQVVAINTIGLTDTVSYHAYRNYNLKDSTLYDINAANPSQNDYRIIAIPFEGRAVNETWLGDTIDTYNIRLWRLFRYAENAYQEYGQADFSSFEPGRGYMLIKKDFTFDVQGQAAHLTSEPERYIHIPLQAGWNLIGNPYPFAIDWAAVMEANPNVNIQQPPKVFRNGGYANTTTLESFEGAFLRNEGETDTLSVPITARTTAVFSRSNYNRKEASAQGWEMPLTISGSKATNHLAGFGMHPEASTASDKYDDYTVPRFTNYVDVTFSKSSAEGITHTKDIIPDTEEYVWEFSVNAEAQGQFELTWDQQVLENSSKALWLLDLQTKQRINMLEQSSYTLHMPVAKSSYAFKVFYASPANINELMLPDEAEVGEPYPNPAEYNINFPFSLPKEKSTQIVIEIYDGSGRKVHALHQEPSSPGFHTLTWNRKDQQGHILPPGMYFYKVHLTGNGEIKTGKIILK